MFMPEVHHEPRTRRIDLGGSHRNLVEWGDPANPMVVLQHGMRDHAYSWSWVAEHLAPRYHVIAPDLRGHGDSDWSPDRNYTLSAFVSDLAQIADTLKTEQFDLIGHSLGGQIALRFAAIFPERVKSLILIEAVELPLIRQEQSCPVPYPQRVRAWIEDGAMQRVRQPRIYLDHASAARRMAEANPGIDSETIAFLAEKGLIEIAPSGFRWKYDHACRSRPPEDQRGADLDEILDAIGCPALLAYGDDSWIAPPSAERLARVRSHKVIQFAHASHWLHHQRRVEFCEMAVQFLDDPVTFLTNERTCYA
jgi:pimeloyl-ACP methyl ester carboxylesterase